MAAKKRKTNKGSAVVNSVQTRSLSARVEDVMFEIFLLIPFRSIFENRLVSKQWCSILSNPMFIVTWMKINNYTQQVALTLDCNLSINQYLSTSSPKNYSNFMSNYDGFSFAFLISQVSPGKLYILASNNGLVLLATTKHYHTKYYVCNPLIKTSVLLPEPPTYTMVQCGLVSSAASIPGYDVIRIPRFASEKTTFSLEIFSSKSGEWTSYEVLCSQAVSMPPWLPIQNNIIAHYGVLYWIEGQGNIIACEMKNHSKDSSGNNNCHSRFIELPKEVTKQTKQCLGEIDGKFFLMHLDVKKSLTVWELTDNHWVSHPHDAKSTSSLCTLAFDGVNKKFVITRYGSDSSEAYDLRTRKFVDQLEGRQVYKRRLTYRTVVLVPSLAPL